MSVSFLGTDPDAGIRGTKNADDSQREYRARFRLRSTLKPSIDVFNQVYAVLKDNGIYLGGFSAIDGGAWIKTIDVNTVKPRNLASAGGARRWDFAADVVYSTKVLNKPEDQPDPTKRTTQIQFETYKWTSPAYDIRPNKRVANSAGDPFVREMRRASLLIKMSKIFDFYDPNLATEVSLDGPGLVLSRNLDAFIPIPAEFATTCLAGPLSVTGILPGYGRIEDMTVRPLWENGQTYSKVDVEIRVDELGFADYVVDQGFLFLGPEGLKHRFVDRSGVLATTPQFLDGGGHKLADTDQPIELPFQYYRQKSWAELKFP